MQLLSVAFIIENRSLSTFVKKTDYRHRAVKQNSPIELHTFLTQEMYRNPLPREKTAVNIGTLTEDAVIEPNIVCSEKHRAFFSEKIGKSFSFNVPFQKWLKANAGKTYGDAIRAYYRILEEKKQCKTEIGRQFEYNTYIRDFFADNPGKSLHDAIVCWNYKKGLPGHHRYEQSDLRALD